jgi:uncharacterized protein
MKVKTLAATFLLSASFHVAHAETASLALLVSNGERDAALVQLAAGADVNALRADGSSALLYAAYQEDVELVQKLLEKGANPNVRNEYGAFALSEAAQLGNKAIVDLLLKHKVNVNVANLEGETALMVAARGGHVGVATALLKAGADVNAKESWGGQSAVMWAAAQSQPEMLKLLIKNKADINTQSAVRLWDRRTMNEPRPKDMNKGGFTPLLYAARQGCTECIGILVKAGADINATDPDRTAALNLALLNQHYETSLALINVGADVNQIDLFGRGPLFNALDLHTLPEGGRPDIPSEDKTTGYDVAKVLLEKGANPNQQLKTRPPYRNAVFDRGADNVLAEGATPLIRAARAADTESVQLLLEHGALVDLPNSRGHTPLLVVAGIDWPAEPTRGRYKTEEQSIDTIKALLAHGANINALTGDPARRPQVALSDPERGAGLQPAIRGEALTDGQTALHAAARVGWSKIAKFLIDNGIKQEQKDSSGRTPFDMAFGRFPPSSRQQVRPVPKIEISKLLQEECMKNDGCQMVNPVDFNNPEALK